MKSTCPRTTTLNDDAGVRPKIGVLNFSRSSGRCCQVWNYNFRFWNAGQKRQKLRRELWKYCTANIERRKPPAWHLSFDDLEHYVIDVAKSSDWKTPSEMAWLGELGYLSVVWVRFSSFALWHLSISRSFGVWPTSHFVIWLMSTDSFHAAGSSPHRRVAGVEKATSPASPMAGLSYTHMCWWRLRFLAHSPNTLFLLFTHEC